jgi:hypothetical protein
MHPADLGKPDGAVVLVQALERDILGRQREGILPDAAPFDRSPKTASRLCFRATSPSPNLTVAQSHGRPISPS